MNDLVYLSPNTEEESMPYPLTFSEVSMNARMGHVYVVEDAERQLCKIGSSVNPKSRTRAIQTTSGICQGRIHISNPIQNFRHCETMAHKVLAFKRTTGEWFDCTFDEAVATVNNVIAQEGNFKLPEPTKYLVPDALQEDCTNWFCSDTPELVSWFRRNGFYITWCCKRKDFVVRASDPEKEFEEMGFGIFATFTIRQANESR